VSAFFTIHSQIYIGDFGIETRITLRVERKEKVCVYLNVVSKRVQWGINCEHVTEPLHDEVRK
jgi:hypothetical protein